MNEKATTAVRVFPTTHKRLKIRAAKEKKTLATVIDELSRPKALKATTTTP